MKNYRLLIIIAVMISLMLACNVSVGDTSAPTTPIVVVVTQLVPADTSVPQQNATETPKALPSDEPTITPTATPSAPMVTPLKDPVNCRFGPSVFYEQVFALAFGAYLPITGKSADGGWWQAQIPNSNNQNCWVAASVVSATGEMNGIPNVIAPMAFITGAKLQINPGSINLGPGCSSIPSSPFSLKGTISTNGPLEIRWHVETEQDGSLPEQTLKFLKFGSQDVSFTYVPSSWKKGNFWIRIVITKPQSMFSDVTYQIKCQ